MGIYSFHLSSYVPSGFPLGLKCISIGLSFLYSTFIKGTSISDSCFGNLGAVSTFSHFVNFTTFDLSFQP